MCNLNILCAYCNKAFTSCDVICATNCGHVFHQSCLNNWKESSGNCPRCRRFYPHTHIIYLDFSSCSQFEKVVNDLVKKSLSAQDEEQRRREEDDENNKLLDEIKSSYHNSEQRKAELEDKIHQLSNEMEEQNAYHSKEIDLKNQEIQWLKKNMEQLGKEIKEICSESAEIIHKCTDLIENSSVSPSPPKPEVNCTRNQKQDDTNNCKVLIRNFPRHLLKFPLHETVILLASRMAMSLTIEDISTVRIIEPSRRSNNIAIAVEFKTLGCKIGFLAQKQRLKYELLTTSIHIREYCDKPVYRLFMYAIKKLRGNGYECIYCKENKVYAKKQYRATRQILIQSRCDVDKLMRQNSVSATVPRYSNRRSN